MTTATASQSPLVQRVIASLNDFPMSRAAVIPTVMRLTTSSSTAPGQLARAISNDPAFSATVLRLSNSSFYGRVRAVSSLTEAVMVLGTALLRSLIVATSISSMFKSKSDELEDVLWRHSLATAIGARIIAQRARVQAEEEVFLAGLVHDLAQLILLQRFVDEYRPVLTEMQQSWSDQLTIERDRLGVTHEEIGAIILEQWNFPPQLTALVRNHHDPNASEETSGENVDERLQRMRHVVFCADVLADSLGHGFGSGLNLTEALRPSAEYLGLALESIPEISEELIARFTEEQELFRG